MTGKEGITAMLGPDDQWLPMVCAGEARLAMFKPFADKLRRDGITVTLARFTVRTDLEDTPT